MLILISKQFLILSYVPLRGQGMRLIFDRKKGEEEGRGSSNTHTSTHTHTHTHTHTQIALAEKIERQNLREKWYILSSAI